VLPVPQRRLEELLEQRAVTLGARILRGHEVTGIDQHDRSVTVRAATPDGDVELHASFLVGCDGAHSVVRTIAGIAFPGVTSATISRLARVTILAETATRHRRAIELHGIGRFQLFGPTFTGRGSITIAPMDALDRSAPDDLYIVST
jgi:2-polyprenyl-6-methoxyphenol hydroxylase-like FAD-dependent oxidoreductase